MRIRLDDLLKKHGIVNDNILIEGAKYTRLWIAGSDGRRRTELSAVPVPVSSAELSAPINPAGITTNGKSVETIASRLKAVSDTTRMEVLFILLEEDDQSVTQLLCELPRVSQPCLSHHLGLLRDTGVVASSRDGQFVRYQLTTMGRSLAEIVRSLSSNGLVR